ncbi:hypothetical protein ACFVYC_20345 [Pseudarthrobacter sp. NPDC058329]|uniref:hypothetical protein n=1 Tax=Pseudarthrobacter sp. NPDC058329 TaxID=3346448 RepID=UPI0036DE414B
MGNSGKFAVIAGLVAAGLLVLTGMTLAEPVFIAFLGVLGLACLACIMEVLRRRRFLMLAIAGLSTSLAVAGSLAFLSTWELASADQTSLFGTPLPTSDPDNYFFLAALALPTALAALFLGAMWPGRRRTTQHPGASRSAGVRSTARGSSTAARRTPARQPGASQPRTPSSGRAPVRQPTSSARQVPQRQGPVRRSAPGQGATNQGAARQSVAKQPQRRPAPRK